MIYETSDGKGGWTGAYKKGRGNFFARQGQFLWIPVKRILFWWVRDKSKPEFYDWPTLFREKENK